MNVKIIINKVLHLFQVRRIHTDRKVVYLTFDDGPEGEITDYVLDILRKYNAKATFFCKGKNVDDNKEQYQRILMEGHAVGNHTYNHINSFLISTKDYVDNVLKASHIVNSHLFRPPYGSMTLWTYLKLCSRFKIIYWSLMSGDTEGESLNLEECMNRLKNKTRRGDIILFHSCYIHENETRKILPEYLEWLSENKYNCEILN